MTGIAWEHSGEPEEKFSDRLREASSGRAEMLVHLGHGQARTQGSAFLRGGSFIS